MHLLSFVLLNNISQIKVSNSLKINFESHKYQNDTENTLFYGLYTYDDYKYILNHKGDKWILWCGNDMDIKNKSRLYLISLLKNIQNNLYYDDTLIENLNTLGLKTRKVSLNKINLSGFLKYTKYITFSDFSIKYYSESQEIISILSNFTNFKHSNVDNANILISYNNSNEFIKDKFFDNNKLHFTNIKNDNFPNDIFFSNYKNLLIKLYYFCINRELCEQILSENNVEERINTVTFVPVWNRHELLIRSINSIKLQTQKSKIVALCSNLIDYEFAKTLDVISILTINLPLGKKYQFGFDFCKLLYPKNVLILGSDDILSENYIENINRYINDYDVVGLKNWHIHEIHENKNYELEYCHEITTYKNQKFWGNRNRNISRKFNSSINGFSLDVLKEFPFSIGAGRSLGYKILNKINWQVYPDAKKMLDTLSLYKLLILNNASYINLNSSEFYITSLKDSNIDMITPKEKYLNSKNIKITELN